MILFLSTCTFIARKTRFKNMLMATFWWNKKWAGSCKNWFCGKLQHHPFDRLFRLLSFHGLATALSYATRSTYESREAPVETALHHLPITLHGTDQHVHALDESSISSWIGLYTLSSSRIPLDRDRIRVKVKPTWLPTSQSILKVGISFENKSHSLWSKPSNYEKF